MDCLIRLEIEGCKDGHRVPETEIFSSSGTLLGSVGLDARRGKVS